MPFVITANHFFSESASILDIDEVMKQFQENMGHQIIYDRSKKKKITSSTIKQPVDPSFNACYD